MEVFFSSDFQTDSEAYWDSYLLDTGCSVPGGKRSWPLTCILYPDTE
jgi:hypothetical protein